VRAMGIETVYQDLALCGNLDAVANFFIGREISKKFLGLEFLQSREMNRQAKEVLSKIGNNFPSVHEQVEYISGGQRQAVALEREINPVRRANFCTWRARDQQRVGSGGTYS